MTDRERAYMTDRLLDERGKLSRRLVTLEQQLAMTLEHADELIREPHDDGRDSANVAAEELSHAVAAESRELLSAIDRALTRLHAEGDAFGRCEQCGESIPFARLDLLPWTSRCVTCEDDAQSVVLSNAEHTS